ncbi:MAG: shikimate dehydrogenase, partial [Oxalobacteraceae bacterium]
MSRTVLVGLIGAGIQASRTPALHEREGAAQGLGYVYRLIDLDTLKLDTSALEELLASAQRLGFTGLNITFPAKQAILPLLDDLSPEARGIGAVNTVVLKDGQRVGHNTDCLGFAEGFRRGLHGAPRRAVVQMGAGGAGAAVAHALLAEGVERLSIFDVEPSRAQALADNLNQHFPGQRAEAGSDLRVAMGVADGLVNTTPMGMAKLPGMPVPKALLRGDLWVAEIVYFP